jgi:hypothetical protein
MNRVLTLSAGTALILAVSCLLPAVAAPAKPATGTSSNAAVPMVDERPDRKLYTFIVNDVESMEDTNALMRKTCEGHDYVSCHVAVIDPQRNLGQITITARPGEIVDRSRLKSDVESTRHSLR